MECNSIHATRQNRREFASASVLMLTVLALSLFACPKTIAVEPLALRVHNVNTGLNYTTIQEAVDAPETLDGHTIGVDAGIYYEQVNINKSLTLLGQDRNTIIDGEGIRECFWFEGAFYKPRINVRVEGFTIQNGWTGIWAEHCNSTIRSNTIFKNRSGGIYVVDFGSVDISNNTISLNSITEDMYGGIRISFYSALGIEKGSISHNTIVRNGGGGGIVLAGSDYDVGNFEISYNNITENSRVGMWLVTDWGMHIHSNNITGNFVARNYGDGISLGDGGSIQENIINNNLVAYNSGNGINMRAYMYYSTRCFDNNITNNVVCYNSGYGITLGGIDGATNNRIHHNYFVDNANQVFAPASDSYDNFWDDGYPSGGNYWSDHVKVDEYSGPRQILPGSDGIVDVPYVINEKNADQYPFVKPLRKVETQTHFTLSPNPALPGQAVTLKGNLTIMDSVTVPNQTLTLKVNGSVLRGVKSNATGWFEGSGSLDSRGTYNLTVEYAGSLVYLPCAHSEMLVVTSQLASSVYFSFNPNPAKPGQTLALSGILVDEFSKPITSASVKVEYSVNNGLTWNYIWTLSTNAAGAFSQGFTAPAAGTYLVRVSYAGSATYSPSSYMQVLTVQTGGKVNTQITFTLSPNPTRSGQTVLLSGTLRDANSNPVYAAQVKVEYSVNGGVSWNFIWNLNTNAAGQFLQSFTAPGAGTYLVRASYAGSTTYNPSSNTQTLTVNP